jgi:hypothetical protein
LKRGVIDVGYKEFRHELIAAVYCCSSADMNEMLIDCLGDDP